MKWVLLWLYLHKNIIFTRGELGEWFRNAIPQRPKLALWKYSTGSTRAPRHIRNNDSGQCFPRLVRIFSRVQLKPQDQIKWGNNMQLRNWFSFNSPNTGSFRPHTIRLFSREHQLAVIELDKSWLYYSLIMTAALVSLFCSSFFVNYLWDMYVCGPPIYHPLLSFA